MYASQWFLTLFTAKFPLCMVFHITDLLLCEVQFDSKYYFIFLLRVHRESSEETFSEDERSSEEVAKKIGHRRKKGSGRGYWDVRTVIKEGGRLH